MADELLSLVDEEAKREHRSRSEFIREAVRAYLRIQRASRTKESKLLKAIKLQEEIAKKDSAVNWDSLQEIRRWRDSAQLS
jgi:metal-responsive CopG/Arc/MetJ family transcriptional regulator